MDLKTYQIKDINPAKYNPREISAMAFQGLCESIKKFNLVEPLVVNIRGDKNVLVGGHQRLKAASHMEMGTVPVVEVDLDPIEEKTLNLLLNSQAISGKFTKGLNEILAEIKSPLGNLYSEMQMHKMELNLKISTDPTPDDNALPDLSENEDAKITSGAVWSLGNHFLICGDCIDSKTIKIFNELDRPQVKPQLLFTSPPYNAGKFKITGKVNQTTLEEKYNGGIGDTMSEPDYLAFLNRVLDTWLDRTETTMINIGLLENNKRPVARWLANYNENLKDILFWKRPQSIPHIVQGIVTNIIEPIYCFGEYNSRKFPHSNFKGTVGNCIELTGNQGNPFAKEHAATMPVHLPEYILLNFSKEKSAVVDPFAGSGTTLIAAEKTGRSCIAIELLPQYCDLIIRRWEKFSGKKAEKLK